MKRKIAVFTGTRAEYGLLYCLMKGIQSSSKLELLTLVSAMHLSPEFGETWRQIESDGFSIDAKIEMLLSSDTAVGIVKSMGLGLIGLSDALARLKPDFLVVLGDRFEALAAAQTALILRIPVVHLHGGEITQGAYDDAIRHAITKLASLHFTATEEYRHRVIQLGEPPCSVYNVGALGLDHLLREATMSQQALGDSLNFKLCSPYFLVTYHPATLAEEDPAVTVREILRALDRFPTHQVIITYPNADNGGRAIIPIIESYAYERAERVVVVPSLGFPRYLAALRNAVAVIGNSSSGIIEAPSFGVPTINIGDRQKGRLAADSVLHSKSDFESICHAISVAISREFSALCQGVVNPYGQGDAASNIVSILEKCDFPNVKRFYDLEF